MNKHKIKEALIKASLIAKFDTTFNGSLPCMRLLTGFRNSILRKYNVNQRNVCPEIGMTYLQKNCPVNFCIFLMGITHIITNNNTCTPTSSTACEHYETVENRCYNKLGV